MRNSMASGFSYTAPGADADEPEIPEVPPMPPQVSISAEEEGQEESEKAAGKRVSKPHLLPPVAFPSESLADSLNLTGSASRPGSRMSTASSKRMSYITELRSKRDRSDTASMITVDEVTAEVESRTQGDETADGEETDGWTAVESSDADAKSVKEMPEEEEEEEEDEDEDEEDDGTDVTVTDDEEPGKTITSHGGKIQAPFRVTSC